MLSGTIAFVGAIAAFQLLPRLPGPGWTVAVAVLLLACGRLFRSRRALTLLGAFGAGLFWAWIHAALILAEPLPVALEGQDLTVTGSVLGLPGADGRRLRFRLRPEHLEFRGEAVPVPGLLRLNWYGDHPAVKPGERWHLTVRLKRPRGLFNPGSFDYERWLFGQGIRATGYVRASSDNRRLGASTSLDGLRAGLASRIEAQLQGREAQGLVRALTVGDRRGVAQEQWEVLAATGTTHLMAISGLHIGLVATLVFFLVRRLWARCGRCCAAAAAPRVAALGAGLAALVYAALAGFSVPTQRALIMAAVALFAAASARPVGAARGIAVALLGVLLIDPLAVLTLGFWLSFAAVATILYGLAGRLRRPSGVRAWGRVQWVVALGLAPLLLAGFNSTSLTAPAANLLAVPWVGFVVVPIALGGVALLPLSETAGALLLEVARAALAFGWPLLEALAAVEPLRAAAPLWTLLPALIGLAWLLAPRGVPLRRLGLLGLVPLLLARPLPPEAGRARLMLLDVGQGLAAVVQTHRHALVYDTGPRFSDSFDAGDAVVVPYLRHLGLERVDTAVLSHADNDHAGGWESVQRAVAVTRVLSSEPERFAGAEVCRRGQRWEWDGVRFELLHPGAGQGAGNDSSCVLRVSAGTHRLLLPGDIEAGAEAELLADGIDLDADVIVVPHHGSTTSSSPEFVAAVGAELALVSAGHNNRWGFPAQEVVGRYRGQGARVLETPRAGPLSLELGGDSLSPRAFRRYARRYWHE